MNLFLGGISKSQVLNYCDSTVAGMYAPEQTNEVEK